MANTFTLTITENTRGNIEINTKNRGIHPLVIVKALSETNCKYVDDTMGIYDPFKEEDSEGLAALQKALKGEPGSFVLSLQELIDLIMGARKHAAKSSGEEKEQAKPAEASGESAAEPTPQPEVAKP